MYWHAIIVIPHIEMKSLMGLGIVVSLLCVPVCPKVSVVQQAVWLLLIRILCMNEEPPFNK
jgi:hypothetical protein